MRLKTPEDDIVFWPESGGEETITKDHLLIVIWLIVDSKDAYKQSLDSDERCC